MHAPHILERDVQGPLRSPFECHPHTLPPLLSMHPPAFAKSHGSLPITPPPRSRHLYARLPSSLAFWNVGRKKRKTMAAMAAMAAMTMRMRMDHHCSLQFELTAATTLTRTARALCWWWWWWWWFWCFGDLFTLACAGIPALESRQHRRIIARPQPTHASKYARLSASRQEREICPSAHPCV